MATGVASWSQTASTNATADTNAQWPEGMAPSQVNDAARGTMASVAKWRDDLAGITTAGTSTAYTVSSWQGYASLAALDGRQITIIMHTSSGAAPTLSVDGLTSKPIRLQTGVSPPTAALVQGSAYALLYNNSNNEFLVRDQVAQVIPTGTIVPFAGSVAPTGWLLCAGQTASQTGATAALFAVCGTTFGPASGGTFTLPDLRGRVIAGVDSNQGSGLANRITAAGLNFDSTVLGNANGLTQNFTLARNQLPDVQPTFTGTAPVKGTVDDTKVLSRTNTGVAADSLSGTSNAFFWQVGLGGYTVTLPTPAGTVQSLNGGVTQVAQSTLQPTMVLNYIIKT